MGMLSLFDRTKDLQRCTAPLGDSPLLSLCFLRQMTHATAGALNYDCLGATMTIFTLLPYTPPDLEH